MLRFVKTFGWLGALVLGFQSAFGFALLGPFNEGWQVAVIAYNLPGDIGGPKNIGEEYRWNTPTNYYAFEASFLDYFGSNGVRAVEQAIGIINALPALSSPDVLDQFPLESQRINARAEQLHMFDLKSQALELLLEELGLAQPDRFLWTLRFRVTQPGLSCPFMIYGVIQRNFDPATFQPTSYINGVLYSYLIIEFCTGGNPLAFPINFPVDPLAQEFSSVTSLGGNLLLIGGLFRYGSYATGLSRDDVGGLRYGWRTNNINWEQTSTDTEMFNTNRIAQLITTSNLTLLAAQSLTNNAAALSALYPGLVITGTTNTFGILRTTNTTAYFTNFPWDPAGTFPHIAFTTNVALTPQTFFNHTFQNLLVIQAAPNGFVAVPAATIPQVTNHSFLTLQNTLVTFQVPPWATFPVLTTNITSKTILNNGVVGEFIILPTNWCGISILGTLLTNVNFTTNIVAAATNNALGTNLTGPVSFEQDLITSATTHTLVIYPVFCTFTNATLREGMERITFLRSSFDSLLGRFFQPITNYYTLIEITNSVAVTNYFRRVVTRPDLLYQAADPSGFPGSEVAFRTITDGNFRTNQENALLAGPGNIEPNMFFIFNKAGPMNINIFGSTNTVLFGLSESTSTTNFMWGSYDGSTNDPILYPSGSSILALENEILFSVTTSVLPDGTVGTPYAAQLDVSGGQQPYTWQVAQGSAPLPPGLSLSSSGVISGTPTADGTFTFTVTVTEAGARTRARILSITINPS